MVPVEAWWMWPGECGARPRSEATMAAAEARGKREQDAEAPSPARPAAEATSPSVTHRVWPPPARPAAEARGEKVCSMASARLEERTAPWKGGKVTVGPPM
jgi:hypothetical protein